MRTQGLRPFAVGAIGEVAIAVFTWAWSWAQALFAHLLKVRAQANTSKR